MASGLKANQFIRCLDVSVPPNDPNLAELSQSILQSCIRNTELAAASVKDGKPARAAQDAIWRPIKKSALVRQVKAADEARAQKEREQVVHSIEGVARDYVYRLKPDAVAQAAEETSKGLESWYTATQAARARPTAMWEHTQMPREEFHPLIERAKALTERIAEDVTTTADPEELERLLELNDMLMTHIQHGKGFMPPPRILLPSQIAFASPAAPPVVTQAAAGLNPRGRRHMRSQSLEISSPNFSIGDSDAESDAEELDATTLAPSSNQRKGSANDTGKASKGKSEHEDIPEEHEHDEVDGEPAKVPDAAEAAAEQLVDHELAQGLASPVERVSRAWVSEEAEIFRKGTRLGVAQDSDSDSDGDADGDTVSVRSGASGHSRSSRSKEDLTGEQLRQEIMETDVPRSPPRQVVELSDEEVDGERNERGE